MKKQIFTIILLLMGGITAFGQFTINGVTNPIRLQTNGIDRLYIAPNSATAPVLPGNVGIGTSTPDAKLDVFGDFSLTKTTRIITPGIQNAVDRRGASFIIFGANSGTYTVNGIAGGVDGMILYLLNLSETTLILNDDNINGIANGKIATNNATGASITINGRGAVTLIYYNTLWRVVSYHN